MFGKLRTLFGGDSGTPAVQNLTPSATAPRIRDVAAEDYPTPQKYLDGAEIPTYYQFQSNLVADEDLKAGMVRNLEVDKRLTLPTRTHIRFLVTGQDVLHCFSIPALGLKADAWKKLDSDNNGMISHGGFQRVLSDEQVFHEADVDVSGFLETPEIENLVERAGLTEQEFNWKEYDHDKDGKLCLAEFLESGPAVATAAAEAAKSFVQHRHEEDSNDEDADETMSLLEENEEDEEAGSEEEHNFEDEVVTFKFFDFTSCDTRGSC